MKGIIKNSVLESYTGLNEKIVLVPHGVRVIGEGAFNNDNAETIKAIVLPETIERIENTAFNGCTGLKYLNLPASIRSIGAYSIPGDVNDILRHLYIPDSVLECGNLGRVEFETLRLPLHLFNGTDCILRAKIKHLIIGLPPEDGITPSQDKFSFEKLKELIHKPAITFEPYTSSHSWDIGPNSLVSKIYAIDGCVIFTESTCGRAYLPEDEFDDAVYTYAASIPKTTLAVPSCVDVLDSECGKHRGSNPLYISPTLEFIAPDAFSNNVTFVTPASNEEHLKEILSRAKFSYQIVAI